MSHEAPAASQPAQRSRASKPGAVLMKVSVIAFFVGIAAIAAIFLIPALGGGKPDLTLYLLAWLCPLGLILGVVAALKAGRRARE